MPVVVARRRRPESETPSARALLLLLKPVSRAQRAAGRASPALPIDLRTTARLLSLAYRFSIFAFDSGAATRLFVHCCSECSLAAQLSSLVPIIAFTFTEACLRRPGSYPRTEHRSSNPQQGRAQVALSLHAVAALPLGCGEERTRDKRNIRMSGSARWCTTAQALENS